MYILSTLSPAIVCYIDGAGIPNKPTQTLVGEQLQLNCVIDANPPIDITNVRWSRLNYNMGRTSQKVTGSGYSRTLTLSINNVVRADIGTFTCEANNTFGSATREYTVTPVPCKYW